MNRVSTSLRGITGGAAVDPLVVMARLDAEADAPPLEPVLVADEAELEGQGVGR